MTSARIISPANDCGKILQEWRRLSRYSQLDLSMEIGISCKHLSFIETGRSIPSRQVIMRIFDFLDLPRSELNRALSSAGYSPHYSCLSENHIDLKPIYEAIDRVLKQQMPYPAFVLDRHWNVVRSNTAMNTLLTSMSLEKHTNIIEGLVAPNFNKNFITNYYQVMSVLLSRFKSETSLIKQDSKLLTLKNKIEHVLRMNNHGFIDIKDTVLNTEFNLDGKKIKLFSTIMELGSVQDVVVGGFKIELMFPLDQITEEYFNE